ncbi:MAG: cell division protein FtsZ [Chitinophagaceae bacterium]|jgi:cell division protein FtsZ
MLQFDLPKEQSSIIKVIGVGGGGSNAVNYMHSLGIGGVDFVVCNTDAQALAISKVPNKVQLGPSLTQGLGAGANPEIGRQATEESLEEIRRILEVNTKMAFVTAGMGGGTGTGGAPIISKICKEMGILTVGIVTTPFSYEGKKRALHADQGINQLRDQVDTLLVISNDKLRHQFGNLTMSAALSTADNVLATAAKCITDVINTTGQINVDFADVCTVMRNGGVAILGSARASGENRAQSAIEKALNSPLLNDSDIKGAKWILININSSTGSYEFTMDEVENIQEFLLSQAGADTDVILGLGYDDSLGEDINITIIATGFEQKSVSGTTESITREVAKDEKVLYTLDTAPSPAPKPIQLVQPEQPVQEVQVEQPIIEEPVVELQQEQPSLELKIEEPVIELEIEQHRVELQIEEVAPVISFEIPVAEVQSIESVEMPTVPPVIGGFLVKPTQIYAEEVPQQESPRAVPVSEPVQELPEPVTQELNLVQPEVNLEFQETSEETFELVYHDAPAVEEPVIQIATPVETIEEVAEVQIDEAEAQRARAAERLYKLRNLSFNFNSADPGNEYDSVPAYVRQNLQVHNTTLASVEKFYSSYAVNKDENNITQISTINTFLEGKKPD